jgi:hypothetical protein
MLWNRQALINLREILARLYPYERDAHRVAMDAKLDVRLIAIEGASIINTWFAILEHARNQGGKIDAIV